MAALPPLICRVIRIAEKYLDYGQLERLTLDNIKPEPAHAGSNGQFADKALKYQRFSFGAAKALRKIGMVLAREMEIAGADSTALLRLLGAADRGGGGFDAVVKQWALLKADLRRLEIRAGLPAPSTNAFVATDAPSRSEPSNSDQASKAAPMESLRDARLARLHKAFLDAAEKYHDLHFAVVTPHDHDNYGWPEFPRPDGNHWFGIQQPRWRELQGKGREEFFANLSTAWLRFRGRLWQGAFFNGGPAAGTAMLNQEALDDSRRHLDEGMAIFKTLAGQAAGNFGLQDIDGRVEFPRTAGLAERWLEFVCQRLLDSSDDHYSTVNYKRLPGDVFTASAQAIENLAQGIEPAGPSDPEMDALLEAAMRENEVDHREHVRQFWIEYCGMPPHFDYYQGLKWAKEKQVRDDAERAEFNAKWRALERRIEERLRDRLLQGGFHDAELQPGMFAQCMPRNSVNPDDPRYSAYMEAMRVQGEEYKAMLRALGCEGEPESEQTRESKANGGGNTSNIATFGELLSKVRHCEAATEHQYRLADKHGGPAAMHYQIQAGLFSFQPDEKAMPGIHRIVKICDQQWGSSITEKCLRHIRGSVAERLGIYDPAEVDAMTVEQVADAYGLLAGNAPLVESQKLDAVAGATFKAGGKVPKPAERLAYLSFEYAECKVGRTLTDREAYDYLHEHGFEADAGELTEYALPPHYPTWERQCRGGRGPLGKSKNNRRAGRSGGRSVVTPDQI